ncbi:MAG: DUF2169 domain-containing protein [Minicystis sp.]
MASPPRAPNDAVVEEHTQPVLALRDPGAARPVARVGGRVEVKVDGPFSAAAVTWRDAGGRLFCTVVAKASYELAPGMCAPLPEPIPIQPEDGHWDDDPEKSVHVPSDLAPFKAAAEVVVVGSAFAPGERPAQSVTVRVIAASVDKSVVAWAPRRLRADGTIEDLPRQTRFSLRYEHAAGGPETDNPPGIDPNRADPRGRRTIPELLPPAFELKRPGDFIPTIGLGPIAAGWRPRMGYLGDQDAAWLRGPRENPLPPGFPPRFFQAAPMDQWLDRPLVANERIVLEGLHDSIPRLVTSLSGIEPWAVVGPGGEPIRLQGDLLFIDTDRTLATLTFRAQVPIDEGRVRAVILGAPMGTAPPPDAVRRAREAAVIAAAPNASPVDTQPWQETTTVDDPRTRTASTQLPFQASSGPPKPATLPFPKASVPPPPRASYPDGALPFAPAAPRGSQPDGALPFAPPAVATRPSSPEGAMPFRPAPSVPPPAPAMGPPVAPAMGPPVAPAMGPPVAPAMGPPVAPAMGPPVAPAMGPPVAPAMGPPVAPAMPPPVPTMASPAPPPRVLPSVPPPPLVPQVEAPPSPPAFVPPAPSLGMRLAQSVSDDLAKPGPSRESVWPPSAAPAPVSPAPAFDREPDRATSPRPLTTLRSDAATAPAAPPVAPANAALAGLKAASDAAAVQDQAAARAASGAPRAEVVAPRRRAVVELLFFDPPIVPRLRALKRLAPLWAAAPRPRVASIDEARREPIDRDRDTVLRALCFARPEGAHEVRRALLDSLDDADLDPPLVLVAGELRPVFDETETLRTTVAVAQPVAGGDKKVLAAIALAQEALGTSLGPRPDTAVSLSRQVEAATSSLSLPPRYVGAQVERALLEERKLKRRKLRGASRVRADLALRDGEALPIYLPDTITGSLPLLPAFPVIAVCEVRPREDAAEAQAEALFAVALGRVLHARSDG